MGTTTVEGLNKPYTVTPIQYVVTNSARFFDWKDIFMMKYCGFFNGASFPEVIKPINLSYHRRFIMNSLFFLKKQIF